MELVDLGIRGCWCVDELPLSLPVFFELLEPPAVHRSCIAGRVPANRVVAIARIGSLTPDPTVVKFACNYCLDPL